MQRTSDKIVQYDLRGMFMAVYPMSNSPVFLKLGDKPLLPIFSSKEKFDEASSWGNFSIAQCKMITDQFEFLESVLEYKKHVSFHVVVDPYITPEGNTRFQLLALDEEEKSLL